MNSDDRVKKTPPGHTGARQRRSSKPEMTHGIPSHSTVKSGTRPEVTKLAEMLETMKPHDHLCLIYESKREWRNAVIPFLAIGLKRGEKCVYVTDTSTAAEIRKYLSKEGIDTVNAEKSGQLLILHETDTYTREGSFDPDRMIALLISETGKAIAEGYPALRVTGEMTWVLRGHSGSEKLLEYEAKLNRDLFPHYPCLALCQYDRWKFDPEIIKGVIVTHPILVRGNRIYHNFYYIPPEEFLNCERAETEAQHWLNNIEREQLMWQELSESRQMFVTLVENMSSGVAIYQAVDDGRDFVFVDFNHAGEGIDNISRDEVIGKSVLKVFPGVREFGLFEVLQHVWRTGKPEHCPVTLYKDNRIAGWRKNYVYKLPGGEIVAIYDDVTEQKKSENSLRESEERFRSLFQSAPDAVMTLDMKGTVTSCNPATERLTGLSSAELVGKHFSKLQTARAKDIPGYTKMFASIIAGKTPKPFEITFTRKDGAILWGEVYVSLLKMNGKIAGIQAITRDITERKNAEIALRESEENYHLLFDNVPAGVSVVQEGAIVFASRQVEQLTGYTLPELQAIDPFDLIHEEDRNKVHEYNAMRARREPVPDRYDFRITRRDGTMRWLSRRIVTISWQGKPSTLVLDTDITQRKQAEEALKESERRYREMADLLPQPIYEIDTEGKVTFTNRAGLESFGYSQQDLDSGVNLFSLVVPQDRARAAGTIQRVFHGEKLSGNEYTALRKDGSTFPILTYAAPIIHRGKTEGARGIAIDITERKQAEEEVKQLANEWQITFDSITDSVSIIDRDFKFVRVNKAFADVLGGKPEGFTGKTCYKEIHNRNEPCPNCYYQKLLQTKMPFTTEVFTPNLGVHVEITISPIFGETGEVIGCVRIGRDITYRKKAEDVLRESEEKFSKVFRSSPNPTSLSTLKEGILIDVNESWTSFLGYSTEEVLGHNVAELGTWAKPGEHSRFVRMLQKEGKVRDREEEFRTMSGELRTALCSAELINIGDGQCVLFTSQDITERKQAEEALRESEEYFRALFEQAGDSIYIMDFEGKHIVNCNKQASITLGYSRDEILQLSASDIEDILTPEEIVATHRRLQVEESLIIQSRHRRKDGTTFPVEIRFSLLDLAQSRFVIATVRDITERKLAEERINTSELRYRRLFETAQDAILILNGDTGQIIDANPFIKDLLGYSMEELLGKNLWDIGELKDTLASKISYQKLHQTGYVRYEHLPLITKDGRQIAVEVVANAYQVDHSNIIQCNIRNVTERKKAQEALQKSEQKYRTLVENIPQKIFHKDRDSVYISCNAHYAQDFKIEPDDISGKTDYDFYPGELAEKYRADDRKIMESGNTEDIEEGYIQDGKEFFVHTIKTPVKDAAGNTTGILGIFWDITESKKAEERINTSELRYRRLFETAQAAILILNGDTGQIIDANPFIKDLLGYSMEELLGKNLWDIGELKDTLASKISYQKLHQTGYVRYEHLPLITKDGRQIAVEVVANAYQVDHSNIIQCNIRDVTERKKAEEAMRESEEKYRSLFDNMLNAFAYNKIVLNEDGQAVDSVYLEVNEAFEKLTGKKREDVIGKTYLEVFPEVKEYSARVLGIYHRVAMTGEKIEFELFSAPTGKWLTVCAYSPLKGNFALVFIDITERKQMETELEIAEQSFRNSLDNSPLGISIVNVDGEIIYANKAILDICGYGSVDELRNTPVKTYYTPESYAEHKERKKLGKLGKPVPSNYEISIVRKDGEIRRLLATRKEVVWDGETKFQIIYQDITERLKMQEQLMAQDRLVSIGQLVSGIAHEMNNPLTGVVGFSELLLGKDLPEDVKKDLVIINKEAKRTANIVKGLLIFARKQGTEKEPVDIHSIIQEVLQLRAYEHRVSNIQVNTRFADLPKVNANGSHMQQVFLNIVINAEQAMLEAHKKGTLTITTEQAEDMVRIAVTDDGPGISPENMRKLFTPFFTTKEVGKGTGLGLSICHGIVTEHGGRIYAESKAGKGATFVVELPVSAGGGESNE